MHYSSVELKTPPERLLNGNQPLLVAAGPGRDAKGRDHER
jgi:hypothetical protein